MTNIKNQNKLYNMKIFPIIMSKYIDLLKYFLNKFSLLNLKKIFWNFVNGFLKNISNLCIEFIFK